MAKKFNVTGICIPQKHYMVDVSPKIDRIIQDYIQEGKYFTINRARQYGKTTLLYLLENRLKEKYVVLNLSFEAADEYFKSSLQLARGLMMDISDRLAAQNIPQGVLDDWNQPVSEDFPMRELGQKITRLCRNCGKDVVLMIDEVDKSSDNQIFLSFLGLLRSKYLEMQAGRNKSFLSVILVGVYDVKNLKLKLHPNEESKYNSPWNVAADFTVDLCFRPEDIATMLLEYEKDHHTGMDIPVISDLLYEYTSGYPYLVSRMCQLMDERLPGTEGFPDLCAVWKRQGIVAAELLSRREPNTLFDDMLKKLADYPQLKQMLQGILFRGSNYPFDKGNDLINLGTAFGFLKNEQGTVAVANRIFETRIYDLLLADMAVYNE